MEWISVEDEKPKDYQDVLLLNNKEKFLACGWYYKESDAFYIDGVKFPIVVTHWIPLPPLPDNCNCANCDEEIRQILDETYHKPIEN